jgi:hypothetical protein
MNGAHWHLVVNHLPIIFPLVGAIIMVIGLVSKSEAVKRTSYFIFILGALASVAAMTTGEGAEEEVENIAEHIAACRDLELDNEKRTVKIIKEFSLPINITQYIKKSNAYVHFYNYMLISRRWCTPKNSPYTNKKVIESMSGKFDMEYKTLSKNLENIFTEEGF